MTLLTVEKLQSKPDVLPLPEQLLNSLGWQEGMTIDFDALQKHLATFVTPAKPTDESSGQTSDQAIEEFITKNSGMVVIDPKNAPSKNLTAKDKALLKQGFGMLKVDSKNAPEGDLLDFDVADHITLFDED